MGLLDHKRTWHYRVGASPRACLDAFVAALSEGSSPATFQIDGQEDGRTACSMWLSERRAFMVGFTNDARFFRPHLRAVGKQLARLAPGVRIETA